jgi:hypothetical protein
MPGIVQGVVMEERKLAPGDELVIDGAFRLTILAIEKDRVLLAVSRDLPQPTVAQMDGWEEPSPRNCG